MAQRGTIKGRNEGPLRGRKKGRNDRQKSIWSENEEKIVYALMDQYPESARINYLQKKTGLSRRTLYKHINELKAKEIIEEDKPEHLLRLNSITYITKKDTPLPQEYPIPKVEEPHILVIRAYADNPFHYELAIGDNIIDSKTSTNIASTIPVSAYYSNLTVRFKAEEGYKLKEYQIAQFPCKPPTCGD